MRGWRGSWLSEQAKLVGRVDGLDIGADHLASRELLRGGCSQEARHMTAGSHDRRQLGQGLLLVDEVDQRGDSIGMGRANGVRNTARGVVARSTVTAEHEVSVTNLLTLVSRIDSGRVTHVRVGPRSRMIPPILPTRRRCT
jgi:hypothetical protein